MTTLSSLPTTDFAYGMRDLALQSAQEAVVKLKTLVPLLSPEDQETLSILMDAELMSVLDESMREASNGQYEPIESILIAL